MKRVMLAGGTDAAKARLSRKGWRFLPLPVLGGKDLEAASKGYALVVFDPAGGYSTEPMLAVALGNPASAVLPKGDPLREEAIDCLCDSAGLAAKPKEGA